MNNINQKINEILSKEKDKMIKNIEWYMNLPGQYSGKLKLNRKYAKTIKEELQNSPDAYPTKLAYILNINPSEYNKKYPGAVMYENYKMKAYGILYINMIENQGWYAEDIGFAIGLELIFKEFIDKHPEWSKLIKI
ncbi:hypothetical protein [Methanosphaera sp. WGK6]|uniref:hypothetical protein n=1 Tax=Methanosphaera sp. WGK6 TaxID=1561964 RepID=UPI00084CD3AA|nr:hypothetical protein [Methanosphaera sp. WGK6]OED29836.1 hypothetical protein NL43_05980 [Methanosphaera sp. WGK6]